MARGLHSCRVRGLCGEPYVRIVTKDILNTLIQLKATHGDLNRAMVILYVSEYGRGSISDIALHLGVNRSVVRRVLQDLSENDT